MLATATWAVPARAITVDYDAALARAAMLDAADRPADAASALVEASHDYPDDYALAIRLAFLRFRAEQWSLSARAYAHALALSAGSSRDARLGLSWARLRMNEDEAARVGFEEVLARNPDDVSARQGLEAIRARARRALRVAPSFTTVGLLYATHPTRRDGISVVPSVSATIRESVTLTLAYRASFYGVDVAPGPAFPPNVRTYTQREVHFSLQVAGDRRTVSLHGARIWDDANPMLPARSFALRATFQVHGTLSLEASLTRFSDEARVRGALEYAIALGRGVSLGPRLAVSASDADLALAVGAELAVVRPRVAFFLAGRGGRERRPIYVSDFVTYATTDTIAAAAGSRIRVALGAHFALTLGYEWQRLLVSTRMGRADAHYPFAGVSGSF